MPITTGYCSNCKQTNQALHLTPAVLQFSGVYGSPAAGADERHVRIRKVMGTQTTGDILVAKDQAGEGRAQVVFVDERDNILFQPLPTGWFTVVPRVGEEVVLTSVPEPDRAAVRKWEEEGVAPEGKCYKGTVLQVRWTVLHVPGRATGTFCTAVVVLKLADEVPQATR